VRVWPRTRPQRHEEEEGLHPNTTGGTFSPCVRPSGRLIPSRAGRITPVPRFNLSTNLELLGLARIGAVVAVAAVATLGCSSTTSKRLTTEKYPPNPEPMSVLLLTKESARPNTRIAHINSFTSDDRSDTTRERQLADLRERAARMGADAVVNVQYLQQQHTGMVADETVPFTAWRPGEMTQYFMRGTAVRYVIDEEISQEIEEAAGRERPASASDIPERSTPTRSTSGRQWAPDEGVRSGY